MRWRRARFRDGSKRYFAKRGEVVFIVWRVAPRGERAWKCLCSAFDSEWYRPSLRAATRWAGEKLGDPVEYRLEREAGVVVKPLTQIQLMTQPVFVYSQTKKEGDERLAWDETALKTSLPKF
ncbi:MAG: hypothetical protein GY854_24720 [Deltaproteobacteria bacterium]|nr:hypothetical protein [Deltaproteobacteria bacterium]